MSLGVSDFDFEETFRDAVHLLNLGKPWMDTETRRVGMKPLTVCSRPARRESSNTPLRAKGDTEVDMVKENLSSRERECAAEHVMWLPLAVVGGEDVGHEACCDAEGAE